MDSIVERIKKNIDLHDLAHRLELVRPNGGNYRAPDRDDKNPSLSIFDTPQGPRWKDFASGKRGSAIDLVMLCQDVEANEAIRLLSQWYGLGDSFPRSPVPPTKKTRAAWIAEKCGAGQDDAIAYLCEVRGIDSDLIKEGYKHKTIGFNRWHSTEKQPGEIGYGGDAVAFIVRAMNEWSQPRAVDLRYLDPELNGGLKTQSQGDKSGYPWIFCLNRLRRAHTVYVVESAINALCVEMCRLPKTTAIAVRGTAAVDSIDWREFLGKQLIICMDNDAPNEFGESPGRSAAWKAYIAALDAGVSAICVDQSEWECNDLNDLLQEHGVDELKLALKRLEPWTIPTIAGRAEGIKNPIYLPAHDYSKYWRYRVQRDFTSYVDEYKNTEEGEQLTINDLATFRIAGIQKVVIESRESVLNGSGGGQGTTMFSVSVQRPVSGPKLYRRTLTEDQLHNIDQWSKFGGVFSKTKFLRLVSILEREALVLERRSANFVGVCYLDGRLVVSEGADSFFLDPELQCPYHDLVFPRGTIEDAQKAISAYQHTFDNNAATMCLAWALGAHLKALIGYWPHIIVQGEKGSGKSTMLERLGRTVGFRMMSGQMLQSDFRMMCSLSCTSNPIGWEEISARSQEKIDRAVSLLQEAYQSTPSQWGAKKIPLLFSAPVVLAGEDVPVRSLLGKTVQTNLDGKKAAMVDARMKPFPVRQWLDFLVSQDKSRLSAILVEAVNYCLANCNAPMDDPGAERMAKNYAAVLTSWRLMCEFAGIDESQGGFKSSLIQDMNTHILETSADRKPFVWILELYLSEIASDRVRSPYVVDLHDGEMALIVRPSHIIDHIAHSVHLRDAWTNMPVKSARVFTRQLKHSGVMVGECQRTINNMRLGRLAVLSVAKLEHLGLCVPYRSGQPPE